MSKIAEFDGAVIMKACLIYPVITLKEMYAVISATL